MTRRERPGTSRQDTTEHWGGYRNIRVWQACALAVGIDPRNIENPDGSFNIAEQHQDTYEVQRFTYLLRHAEGWWGESRDRAPFKGGDRSMGARQAHVPLAEFRVWAEPILKRWPGMDGRSTDSPGLHECFPNTAAEASRGDARERDNLLKAIGVLAWLLARQAGQFHIGARPNASALANGVAQLLEGSSAHVVKEAVTGIKPKKLAQYISTGVKLLTDSAAHTHRDGEPSDGTPADSE